MRRAVPHILSALVALALPAVLLGNGLWILTNDWYVHAEYARPGFPDDRYGLTRDERTSLALVGLDAIQPYDRDGLADLRAARLPDGATAFGAREVAHMADVRGLVGAVLLAHVVALAVAAACLLLLGRIRAPGATARGLAGGGLLTLAIGAALGIYMLANFDGFFVQFHEALFEGDSWRFPSSATLIRLYPDAFWSDFAAVLAGLTVVQAAVLAGLAARRLRRARSAPSEAAASETFARPPLA